MQEYLVCGVRLGWLIDSQNQRVEVYRLDHRIVELCIEILIVFGKTVEASV